MRCKHKFKHLLKFDQNNANLISYKDNHKMQINLILDIEEVNGLLNLIGQMPTSTNVWPLANKIRSMAEAQMPQEGAPDATSSLD